MKPISVLAGPPSSRLNGLREGMKCAVGERVAVDCEERLHCKRGLELGDLRAEPVGRDMGGVVDGHRPRGRRARSDRRRRPSAWAGGSAPPCPQMAAGTSGTPASSAIRAAPERQRASCRLRRPFSRRVPSGNMTTMCPSRHSRIAVSIASRSCSPRRTGKAPQAAMNGPSGNQKSSDFAMKRRYRRGKSAMPSGQGSAFERWLAARTYPPAAGSRSRPCQRSRKTMRNTG